MHKMAVALRKYKAACGAYPITEAGLDRLTQELNCKGSHSGALLKEIEKDAWGHDIVYESNGKSFKLVSLGRDGKAGGAGLDSDIVVTN
jgi:general secretion pathway protein G